MEFCDECGSIMHREDGIWECRSCGYQDVADPDADYTITDAQEESEIIDISDAEDRGLPTTEVVCPACEHTSAYWYMQQIRSADESETRFFVCTECEHRWREDDH